MAEFTLAIVYVHPLIRAARPRIRQLLYRDRALLLAGVVAILAGFGFAYLDYTGRNYSVEAATVRSDTIVEAEVVSAGPGPWPDRRFRVEVDANGEPLPVRGAERLVPAPAVHQQIRVVFEKDHALAADVEWKVSARHRTLITLLGIIPVTLGLVGAWLLWSRVRLRRPVRRALSRARRIEPVRVLEIVRKLPSDDLWIRRRDGSVETQVGLVIEDLDGRRWLWMVSDFRPDLVREGDVIRVTGQPAPDGWLVGIVPSGVGSLVHDPPTVLVPTAPLDH
ncbi:hypothetical protein [Kribbella sp. NPDC055071]